MVSESVFIKNHLLAKNNSYFFILTKIKDLLVLCCDIGHDA